jgi:hypothetical protein
MGITIILVGALVALIAAWFVNSLVSLLSGERPGDLLRTWWDIFSHLGKRSSVYVEPVPEVLIPKRFVVGDQVRVLFIPPEVERFMSDDRRELFRRCVGKVLRVEGYDSFGALELHVLDDGTQSPDHLHHVLFIEPKYVERAAVSAK